MGCTHCMNGCTGTGKDMDARTFRAALQFMDRAAVSFVVVGGGEPTLHPGFFDIAGMMARRFAVVMIASNGTFLEDGGKRDEMGALLDDHGNVFLQVTNDPRYYPERIDGTLLAMYPRAVFVDHISRLDMLGRAREYHATSTSMPGRQACKPSCTNLYLLARQVSCFEEIIDAMESVVATGKCKPSIDPFGNVRAGESLQCTVIGTVHDNVDGMFNMLETGMPCNACGGMDASLERKISSITRIPVPWR